MKVTGIYESKMKGLSWLLRKDVNLSLKNVLSLDKNEILDNVYLEFI